MLEAMKIRVASYRRQLRIFIHTVKVGVATQPLGISLQHVASLITDGQTPKATP
jgi:hypothetical protein